MSAYRPFFPRLLLSRARSLDPSGPALTLPGACLFADVSGFTAMSEALLAMGKEGSEVLTKVLNGFYAELVDAAVAHGGDVMRFAGDAVTVHFPDEAAALRAGLAMQGLMPRFHSIPTPAGEFTLRMKAGVSAGEAHFFLVEGAGRRDYVYSGDPVDGSAEAEHHAEAGEVVVKRGAGFEKVHDAPGGTGHAEKEEGLPPGDALAPFLHPLLWEALEAGQSALLNEHRHISVLFVSFHSREEGKADPVAGVRAFYRAAAERVAEYDGYINKVDMGDKGSKLLVLFGAPRAHEDDEQRALACARTLEQEAKAAGFGVRMGLNSAKVFCGVVGSGERCEYTVMGDGVNVAARLMQAAPEGGCLVSPSVKARSGGRLAFRDLPPLALKGKKEPLPVHLLEGLKGADEELPFFVGREVEEKTLLDAVQAQPKDQAGLYVITGEAGVGKTAFVTWFLGRHLRDHRVVRHHCSSHAAGIPYAAFRAILPELLPGEDTAGASREVIEKRDPEIVEYLPILLNTFGLTASPLEEPPLEPEVRRSLLWKMVGHVVDASLAPHALVLAMEGVQWLDDESRALMTQLIRMGESGKLRGFFTQRDSPEREEGVWRSDIALGPFPEKATEGYLKAALSVEDMPVEAVRKVFASSHGNLLLARESLALLFQSGYLSRDEEYPQVLLVDESKSPDLPDSISGLVLSRLDALPLVDRTILRTMAVVGEQVSLILARELALDADRLEALVRDGDFLGKEEDPGGYRFLQSHAVSAIYDSLEYAQRRELHGRIGLILKGILPPQDPQSCHILARHLSQAGMNDAIPYLLEVAAQAKRAFAINQAIQALERALALTHALDSELSQAVIDLGRLLLLAGRTEEALKAIDKRARDLHPAHRGSAQCLLAESYLALGQIPQAEAILKRMMASAGHGQDDFHARCLLGKLYGRSGQMQKAKEIIEEIDHHWRARSSDKEFKLNRMRLAFIEYQMGNTEPAIRTFINLKRQFERKGDIVAAYTIGNNLGHIYALSGQHRKAFRLFLGFYNLAKKYGIWQSEIYLGLLDNIGNQLMDLGDWGRAEQFFLQDLAYSKRNDMAHLFKPLYLLGEVEIYKGNLRRALDLLQEAIEQCEKHGSPNNIEVLEQLANLALVLSDESLFASAISGYEDAIQKRGMAYLQAELDSFRAEGSLLFDDPARFVKSQVRALVSCMEEERYIEAFRCARFLLQSTGERKWLEQMERVLARCSKKQFHVAFRYLDYRAAPTLERKQKLVRIIERYPYADWTWKANVELAKHDSPAARKARINKAIKITRKMMEGLDPLYRRSFSAQPQYHALRDLAREVGLAEARDSL